MNAKTKRRMVVVTGIIVIVLVVILAVVGGTSSAKTVSVAEAATGSYADQKIQVSGNVVENSFATEGNVLTFDIYDPNGDITQQLRVRFEGGVSATFGNDVTAICTGKVGEDGVVVDKPVKVAGAVKDGTLKAAGEGDRFVLVDPENGEELAVEFNDAISEEVKDGSSLVLTGSMNAQGKFSATEVALEG